MPGENRREDLEAALSQLSEDSGSEGTTASPSPAQDPGIEDASIIRETTRDASGRFAPKTPTQNEVPPGTEQTAETVPGVATPAPQPTNLAPPMSWRADVRQEWNALPPKVQQEIYRREQKIEEGLRNSVQARQWQDEFQRTISPYMGFIAAENSTPIRAVEELMRTAAALRTSPPGQRAQIIASIVNQYGVDVNLLDQALAGQLQPQPQDHIQQMLDARLAPMQQFFSQIEERVKANQQQVEQSMVNDWQTFASQNEYAWDLKDDIADILEMGAKRGLQISLQDAYARASMLHPTIAGLVQTSGTTQVTAQQSTAAARRAREAAASVTGSGAPSQAGSDEVGDDRRAAISASIRQLASSSR